MFQAPKQSTDISEDELSVFVTNRFPLRERLKGALQAEKK